jgi:hypothetical protein
MDYKRINVPSTANGKRSQGLTVDKTCNLLIASQPLVWALAIVLGLLGVTLIVRHLWKKEHALKEEPRASGNDVATWVRQ